MQRRPQFQHFPLNKQQLSEISEQKKAIEKDIKDNSQEIRMLNNKMAKNDYQLNYLHRLHQRQQILDTKKRDLDQILRTHQILQEQLNMTKQSEQKFRSTLANQYKTAIEQKKIKNDQQRKKKIQQQQAINQYNQRMYELEQERKRRELYQSKRAIQQQLAMKQTMKQKQRQQKQRQKDQFNRKVTLRNQIQTQKQAVYKQYYSNFLENQNRRQTVYNDKTAPYIQQKQKIKEDIAKKQQEQFARQQSFLNQQRINKNMKDKQMLRTFLQNQIQQKQKRKSIQLQQRRNYNQQALQYQLSQKQHQNVQKLRRKQQQKRYDEDLAYQIKMRSSMNRDNSNQLQRLHNPITNPIDFKIGITNPYVIKQYQQTKEKFVGDRDLKLKNLALIGNNSLTSHH